MYKCISVCKEVAQIVCRSVSVIVLCHQHERALSSNNPLHCSHLSLADPLSIHLLVSFIVFINNPSINCSLKSPYGKKKKKKKQTSPLSTKPLRHVFLVWKPAIKRESWGKYSSRTLTRPHLAIIYKWCVLCGQQRVELWWWLWLWETDVPECCSPTLIRPEIYPPLPSTIFKAKQSLSSERGLLFFVAEYLGFFL